jgi:uncharacterized protein (TIGR02599 family)
MADNVVAGTSSKNMGDRAFSLVEMLVSLAIFAMIMVIVLQIITATETSWKHFSGNTQAFQGARTAFDAVYRSLSEATLNTYYDYYDSGRNRRTAANSATFVPSVYGRYSELHFITGKSLVTLPRPQITQSVFFQTPVNYTADNTDYGTTTSLLNAVGFYVDFNSDQSSRPSFFSSLATQPAARWRYRLMEFIQPTEQLTVYTSLTGTNWFSTPLQSTNPSPSVAVLGENIIACVACPHLAGEMTPTSTGTGTTLTSNYEYDSRAASNPWTSGTQPVNMNQLPPLVRLVLIATDEASMTQIQHGSTSQPDMGFTYSSVFQDPSKLDADIATVTTALAGKHINYRVFQTDVPIRSAHWSQ